MAPPTAKTSAGDKVLVGADIDVRDPKQRVQDYMRTMKTGTYTVGFDIDLLTNHLRLTAATEGTATFKFTVAKEYCNRMGNLHGGAAALIFDICTTCTLVPIAREGFWQFAGVTRNLNVTYLRPAPMGAEVEVFCEVVHAGQRLATIRGEIRKDGKVLSICEHLKATIDPPKL